MLTGGKNIGFGIHQNNQDVGCEEPPVPLIIHVIFTHNLFSESSYNSDNSHSTSFTGLSEDGAYENL